MKEVIIIKLYLIFFLMLSSCISQVDVTLLPKSISGGGNSTPGLTSDLSGYHMGASWLTGSGGPLNSLVGEERGFNIYPDPLGGAYFVGYSSSSFIEANANRDIILLRYNSNATLAWVKHYGTTTLASNTSGEAMYGANQTDRAPELVFDNSANPIIVASTQSSLYDTVDSLDVFLMSVSRTDGSVNWGQQFGQTVSANNSQDIVISAKRTGNKILIGCVTNGDFAGNGAGGNDDILFIETDLSGNYLSSHQVNTRAVGGASISNERLYAMEVVSDGILISGLAPNNVFSGTGGTTFSAFLVKLNFSYAIQWAYTFGDNDPAGLGIVDGSKLYILNMLKTDSSGNIYTAGYANSGTGVNAFKEDCSNTCSVVLSLNSAGTSRWVTQFGATTVGAGAPFIGNTANDQITHLFVNDDGLFFAGYTQGHLFDTKVGTDTSVTLGKLNSTTGSVEWADQLGDSKYGTEFLAGSHTSHERPTSIYVFGDKVYVSGWTENNTAQANEGVRDNFVFTWDKSTGAMDTP